MGDGTSSLAVVEEITWSGTSSQTGEGKTVASADTSDETNLKTSASTCSDLEAACATFVGANRIKLAATAKILNASISSPLFPPTLLRRE